MSQGHWLRNYCTQAHKFCGAWMSQSLPYISVEIGVRAQYLRATQASWALEYMFAASIHPPLLARNLVPALISTSVNRSHKALMGFVDFDIWGHGEGHITSYLVLANSLTSLTLLYHCIFLFTSSFLDNSGDSEFLSLYFVIIVQKFPQMGSGFYKVMIAID